MKVLGSHGVLLEEIHKENVENKVGFSTPRWALTWSLQVELNNPYT